MASRRKAGTGRGLVLLLASLCLLVATPGVAQSSGEGEIAFQTYMERDGSQSQRTTGAAFSFQNFLPGTGLLKGSFQGWDYNGAYRGGDTYLELSGVSMLGRHWDFVAGDFRATTNLIANPFTNLYMPEIRLRGGRVGIAHGSWNFSVFGGSESLLQGPRIPFRLALPQVAAGITANYRHKNFEIGARFLHLAQTGTVDSALLLDSRQVASADVVALQTLYRLSKQLRFFGELSGSRAEGGVPSRGPLSLFAGAEWQSADFTVRANYTRQNESYLPLPGYFLGDRKGPFAEAHYRVNRALELHASANAYRNNVSDNPSLPTFRSGSYGAGASMQLFSRTSLNVDYSRITLSMQPAGDAAVQQSRDTQWTIAVTRPFGHQHLRFAWTNLGISDTLAPRHQRFYEWEDTAIFRHFNFGGAVRIQNASDPGQQRTTLYFRTNAQVTLRRFSAYAQFHKGNDLANSSLFATNSFTTTVFGGNVQLPNGWEGQAEVFRNQMVSNLNPESIFVMQGNGGAVPATLSGFNQWSTYIKISKHLHWGAELPQGGTVRGLQVPLVGAVDGLVQRFQDGSPLGVAGVPVMLDNSRTTVTDATGHYEFVQVPEGFHLVEVKERELDTGLERVQPLVRKVEVHARALSHADLGVRRLTSFAGVIHAPKGLLLSDVVIHLLPGDRYTTPDDDGRFAFYDLPEGHYTVQIDPASLPASAVVEGADEKSIALGLTASASPLEFSLAVQSKSVPIRSVFTQEISVGGGNK